ASDFGGKTESDFIRCELVNSVGVLKSCQLATQVKAKHFIFLSSLFASYNFQNSSYGIYGLSKRHAEEVAQLFCHEFDLFLTILRPPQLYDEASKLRKHQAMFFYIIDQAEKGQDIFIYGSHDPRRNFLHVFDLAEICARVLKNRHHGLFLCPHPETVTLGQVATIAFSIFGRGGSVKFQKEKPDLKDLPQVSDFELYKKIDFYPQITLSHGIKKIKFFREALG
ncbi:MAG: NAD(P)-dependent oxidoreductase, partial [Holosporales bacterium]|nr:NAD(P)-dependent oxidoreductase [Holosporales bacterium]